MGYIQDLGVSTQEFQNPFCLMKILCQLRIVVIWGMDKPTQAASSSKAICSCVLVLNI